eukprot:TRINITY_DN66300_c6_g1_i1.p1 TRINITY_DN66300_c6_g1~~TRINITY_DN66300_c6_g1_i1.p1  ORF type:complete len:463 (-),score=239.90 TRINITY_DN66300_c6_g1_i1:32-1420(-)
MNREQQEQVSLVCEVVHCDPDVAAQLLEQHGWNVQATINAMTVDPTTPSAAASVSASAASTSSASSAASASQEHQPQQQQQHAPAGNMGALPGAALVRGLFGVMGKVMTTVLPPAVRGVERDVQSEFLSSLEDDFKFVPAFVKGSFKTAVSTARDRGQLLFVYLHSPQHEDTPRFLRECVCTETMMNFLNENATAWAGNIQHNDAFRVSSILAADTFPFVALLVPPSSASGRVAVLYRHSGIFDANDLVVDLLQYMEAHAHGVQSQQRKVSRQTEASIIRQTQDLEYEEALMRDRAMRREQEQKREAERKRAEEEAELKRIEEERQREAERLENEKRESIAEMRAALPPEPSADHAANEVASVAVRLPHGKSLQRRFLLTAPLGVVYDFVRSHETWGDSGADADFTLVSRAIPGQPKREFTDRSVTLRSLGLGRKILLLFESAASDSEDESSSEEDSDSDSE